VGAAKRAVRLFLRHHDSYLYLLPLLVPMALAWGRGADYLLHLAQRMGPAWRRAALLGVLLLPVGSLALHWQAADLSHDRTAHGYMQQALDRAAPGALIVVQGDGPTFALWYGLYARGSGPTSPWSTGHCWPIGVSGSGPQAVPGTAIAEPTDGSVEVDNLVCELIAASLGRRAVYATDPTRRGERGFSL